MSLLLLCQPFHLHLKKTDSVETVETNAFKRGFGAVKNFFRGGKRENSNVVKSEKHVKVSQEKKRSESLVKSKKTVAVKRRRKNLRIIPLRNFMICRLPIILKFRN